MTSLPMAFMDELMSVCQGGRVDARVDRNGKPHGGAWRGSPTPRPVAIEYHLLAHGMDPDTLEQAVLTSEESGP